MKDISEARALSFVVNGGLECAATAAFNAAATAATAPILQVSWFPSHKFLMYTYVSINTNYICVVPQCHMMAHSSPV